eukprot:TRINITY_DN1532_c0_g1_i5.p2 TRINITY_DN1532_c0_g1~~TRINITY_DN1532_c0_g1_i5.p2  ORF type:complete len:119 (+),score=19.49 TRINITY_DN1532_c0_g1_i5:56-412(+)
MNITTPQVALPAQVLRVRQILTSQYDMHFAPEEVPRDPLLQFLGRNILGSSVSATSTDHETQDISQTLTSNGTFWSSTGSSHSEPGECDETLVYAMKSHICLPTLISVQFYRAVYQYG